MPSPHVAVTQAVGSQAACGNSLPALCETVRRFQAGCAHAQMRHTAIQLPLFVFFLVWWLVEPLSFTDQAPPSHHTAAVARLAPCLRVVVVVVSSLVASPPPFSLLPPLCVASSLIS